MFFFFFNRGIIPPNSPKNHGIIPPGESHLDDPSRTIPNKTWADGGKNHGEIIMKSPCMVKFPTGNPHGLSLLSLARIYIAMFDGCFFRSPLTGQDETGT